MLGIKMFYILLILSNQNDDHPFLFNFFNKMYNDINEKRRGEYNETTKTKFN